MEKLNLLLRKTLAPATADEVCFTYVPKERIDKDIFTARFGDAEVEDDGVTYSFNKRKLQLCFKNPVQAVFSWTLSIPPYAERSITSVAMVATTATPDLVTATYVPEHATAAGMTVLHFYKKGAAEEFMGGAVR